MTILMIACSRRAYQLMQEVKEKWLEYEAKKNPNQSKSRMETHFICKVKCGSLPEISEERPLSECVRDGFETGADAILFFCAAGIAVRAVAPFIRHKSVDPAVLVIDETGKFCISLLSGHAGGANELAERIGDLIGATPVITTATDREDKFAVDDFARKNDLVLTDWKLAKKISAAILEGERIGFCSELPVEGSLPKELSLLDSKEGEEFWAERKSACENIEKFHHKRIIIVSCRSLEDLADPDTLQLIPKLIVAGIGCRKGTPEKKIAFAIARCLKEEQIRPEALSALASIELKREEEGLLSYCKSRGLPFLTYSTDTLKQVPGEFTDSPFVKQVTGVSNVCERSAAASGGCLICRKRIYEGVTVALAKKKGSVVF